MVVDWRDLRERFPRAFALMVVGKRLRTKVGLGVVIACVADGFVFWEPPFDLRHPNTWVILGVAMIGLGAAFRIAALGCLQKKEALATTGIYSLCRHPLYLGSILMTYGFCLILDDWVNYLVATAYFLIFYSLAIAWEEIRLAERFGEQHRQFAARTPLLVPLGRFRGDEFRLGLAMRNGGAVLIGVTGFLLLADAVLGKVMQP